MGYGVHSSEVFVLFLALAAGSILYVVGELLHAGRRLAARELAMWGLLAGFLAGYATDWRRLSPLFSIRAFRHIARPVEINPWLDGTGRGTFPNAVRQVQRAIAFARAPREPLLAGGFRPAPSRPAPADGEEPGPRASHAAPPSWGRGGILRAPPAGGRGPPAPRTMGGTPRERRAP